MYRSTIAHGRLKVWCFEPHLHVQKISTARQIFGTVPRLPVPRLPPRGSLGTPKILSTGATLHLGPIRLHVENWECRAFKSAARRQKFGVPCRFFSASKWGFGHKTSWSAGGERAGARNNGLQEEFWEIQNGGLLLRFPFLEISEIIIMETFTLGTAIGLNNKARLSRPSFFLSWLCFCW